MCTSGSSKSSEAYFAFRASVKEREGSGLRVGRMKEAAVACLLKPRDVQSVLDTTLSGVYVAHIQST